MLLTIILTMRENNINKLKFLCRKNENKYMVFFEGVGAVRGGK
jgi:hypothetical protein